MWNYRLTGNGNWHRIDGTVDYHCANSDHEELHIDHMTLILLQTIASRETGTGVGLILSPHGKVELATVDGTVDCHCANFDHLELNIDHLSLVLLYTVASRETGTGVGLMGL
ncbi:hypothetical protein J6590_075808 [Homalodisca vitripennis]|nr:hypothetical protein J6590_075808 [Homalodisca vitripennis]